MNTVNPREIAEIAGRNKAAWDSATFDSKCPDCPNLKAVRSIEEYLIQVTPDVVISLCNRLVWLENMFRRQAVPELYQALEKAVNDYGSTGGPWNVPSEPGTWLAMAQAALAKARGEANGQG